MKFGKYIRTVWYPPWADQYVDYKLLKTYLKPFEDGVATQEHEDQFLACLHAQINKVGALFLNFAILDLCVTGTFLDSFACTTGRCFLQQKRGRIPWII